jgi:hypothetical protein
VPLRGRTFRAAATVALVGLISSCGLENIPYVYEPQQPTALGDTFTFASPDTTGPYFEGYEIYYKLYTGSDDPALGSETSFATQTALASAGFLRLTQEGDTTENVPLVAVPVGDRVTPHSVSIVFPDGQQPYLTTSWDPVTQVVLRRGMKYPASELLSGTYQTFADFSADDVQLTPSDLSTPVWMEIQAGRRVRVALFAVSYGLDFNAPLYSVPLYLFNLDYLAVTQ